MKRESIKTYSYRISQASRTQLVVIMYDMAQEYIHDALELLPSDKDGFCRNIRQVKRIVDELSSSLDMQYDISKELFVLYMQAGKILVSCLANKSDEGLSKVLHMFECLRKSFYEISKQDNSAPVLKNTQQVYAGLTYSSAGSSNEISTDPLSNRGYMV